MKKVLITLMMVVTAGLLTGCVKQKPVEKDMSGLSDDDSLKKIEQEFKQTEVDDFEAELESLDQEINQL